MKAGFDDLMVVYSIPSNPVAAAVRIKTMNCFYR